MRFPANRMSYASVERYIGELTRISRKHAAASGKVVEVNGDSGPSASVDYRAHRR